MNQCRVSSKGLSPA